VETCTLTRGRLLGHDGPPWLQQEEIVSDLEGVKQTATATVTSPGSDIPALFSNRFYVVVAGDITRLVFSEGLGGETINSHTAIVMPTTDAEDLGRILLDTIAKNRSLTLKAETGHFKVTGSDIPDGR
jgi:hypothetical protein